MPSQPPRVFLDTTCLKYAADRLIRGRTFPSQTSWGDARVSIPLTRWAEVYPNQNLHWRQRLQAALLRSVAHLAAKGEIALVCNLEARLEFWGLPRTNAPAGLFYGAPITWVEAPLRYSRILFGGIPGLEVRHGSTSRYPDARGHQYTFLSNLQATRFLQLQRATGAHQGSVKNRNQLLDAFHIWCAEGCGAAYFLTLDFKLLEHIGRHRKYPPNVACVPPSGLLKRLWMDGVVCWRHVAPLLHQTLAPVRRPTSGHPLEELLALSHHLDRRERHSRFRRWFGAA